MARARTQKATSSGGLGQKAPVKTYNILSIDGGPAALLQVRILRKLEEAAPGFLAATDIFAGTSNGSMISMFLASRLPADHDEAVRLSPAILDDAITFSNATIQALHPTLASTLGFFTGTAPMSSMGPLADVLDGALGDMRFCDLARGAVVASMDMNAWQPRAFRVFPGKPQLDGEMRLADAIMASSSLPILLSLFGDVRGNHFVDGAFVANNPSMLAIAYVMDELAYRSRPTTDTASAHQLKMSRVLSLGVNDSIEGMHAALQGSGLVGAKRNSSGSDSPKAPGMLHWGIFQLVLQRPKLLVELLYQGQNSEVARQCEALLGSRHFFRYAPFAPVFAAIEDMIAGNSARLIEKIDIAADLLWSTPDSQEPRECQTKGLVQFAKQRWLGDSRKRA